ncbi:1-acyl-sn-glycerol-3-phosphate acyltransferase [uncultured Tenacibaculum sp.]|uniref:1-acyl-sn-glycerol-3-phosphate acyltransferase n=1 Tax=uncultured Tenacibaculum sp. TaxID=174713 RepID=UPI0026246AC2|nr:1-acyl-sn-glycerol-3-phosphate acyltransferase [uncultured Tenacibaculum sp.]
MTQAISKFIFHKILGWKIVGAFPKDLKKYIIIGAPHTSWKDFPIAILTRNVIQIPIDFVGKASLFKPPFGFIYRWLGGTPVDRTKSNNFVDSVVQIYNEKEEFRLALSPEGTRKYTKKWKTGFYYIAKGANIPVVMFAFDFKNKQIVVAEPYHVTDSIEKDFDAFLEFYKDIVPAKPEQFNNKKLL